MPSRRYFLSIAPVAHINGKMAPQWQKCPNTEDPGKENQGFWYGFKRAADPSVSRFGVRLVSRNLIDHPYTAAEDENRTLFTSSLFAVYDHKTIAADWALMLEDFARQTHYTTPIGYAVAACRANGGEWLQEWVA